MLPCLACPPAPGVDLPHVAAALVTHSLTLLVIAPASQAPAAADTAQSGSALGAALATALQAKKPDLAVDIASLDNRGMGVADMMPILADRLAQHPAEIVIWQAGAAEIMRATPVATLGASLSDAARMIGTAGGDLLIVDPDPALQSNPNFFPVEATLAQAADHAGTALYRQSPDSSCTVLSIAAILTQPR